MRRAAVLIGFKVSGAGSPHASYSPQGKRLLYDMMAVMVPGELQVGIYISSWPFQHFFGL